MGKVTIYTCDKCGHEQTEQDKPHQLWEVYVGARSMGSTYPVVAARPDLKKLWCRDCAIKQGVVKKSPHSQSEAKPIEPQPTIEDLIRDIVEDEVQRANEL